jgi:hypothetical protein
MAKHEVIEALVSHEVPEDLLALYEVLEFIGEIKKPKQNLRQLVRHAVRPLGVTTPPLNFVSRAEWGARAPRSTTKLTTARGNTLHWEGPRMGTFEHSSCATKVRGIQAFHMNSRGWADIAYSSIICPHSYIFEGRWYGIRTAANGTNEGNGASYAHCYLGGSGDPFDLPAKRGIVRVFDHFEGRGSGTGRWAHRDWKATECPGNAQTAWLKGGMMLDPAPAPPTPESCTVNLPVLRPGASGGVVRSLQALLNTKAGASLTIDGSFGPATTTAVKNVQRFFGQTQDGVVGEKTWGVLFL